MPTMYAGPTMLAPEAGFAAPKRRRPREEEREAERPANAGGHPGAGAPQDDPEWRECVARAAAHWPGPQVRGRTRTRRRTQLVRAEGGAALAEDIRRHAPAAQAAARPHLATIARYLRERFLGSQVCVLTQAGRVQGELVDVTDEALILAGADGERRSLPLFAILSAAAAGRA